jgi:flagellar FliJ protein
MAKRFTFRLDTLLKIRQQREDEQKRVVAERLRQIGQVRDQLDALQNQIRDETDAIRSGQAGGVIDIQQVMRHRSWLGHLHCGVLEAEARERFLEARLAQERVVLAEAVKQRRILAKLKERQFERYQRDEQKRETRESDELATVRYVFSRQGDELALAT